MKNKIIIIFERSYFYKVHLQQFGITKMREKDYDVVLWSLADWTFGWKEHKVSENLMEDFIVIKNKNAFDQQIEKIKGEKVVFLIYPYHAYNMISSYIRKTVKEHNFCFINITESPNMELGRRLPVNNKFLFYFLWAGHAAKTCARILIYYFYYITKKEERKKIKKELKQYINAHTSPLKYKSVYNIVTTRMAYYPFPMYLERISRRNIVVNSDDYSSFIEKKNQERYIKEDYVVFIDQGVTQYLVQPGQKKPVRDEKKYWEEINRFLGLAEKQFKCKAIIAVHPKAKYVNGEYGDRELVYGETFNLIKYALCVVFMFSTSVNYIILHKKPFIQIYSEELMKGGFSEVLNKVYNNYKEEFGHNLLNISENKYNVSDYVCQYEKKTYQDYMEKYLVDKRGIKDKTLVDVLMEKIQIIFADYENFIS